mmetsp:Transcript_83315/g.131834  ORF Transcript_83315/g.131834 Transcript_83315/m.131834 type:complete len:241 (-) Transcript_83315:102-824(-)
MVTIDTASPSAAGALAKHLSTLQPRWQRFTVQTARWNCGSDIIHRRLRREGRPSGPTAHGGGCGARRKMLWAAMGILKQDPFLLQLLALNFQILHHSSLAACFNFALTRSSRIPGPLQVSPLTRCEDWVMRTLYIAHAVSILNSVGGPAWAMPSSTTRKLWTLFALDRLGGQRALMLQQWEEADGPNSPVVERARIRTYSAPSQKTHCCPGAAFKPLPFHVMETPDCLSLVCKRELIGLL